MISSKQFLFFVCLVVTPLASSPARAHTFNNGGGLGEANIAALWLNLDSYLSACSQDATCRGNEASVHLITALLQSMGAERQAGLPRFRSPADAPGFFGSDGSLPFRSGSGVGDEVTFNLDAVYPKNLVTGLRSPCTIGSCARLVVTALSSHHVEGRDPNLVDDLGRRLENLAEATSHSFTLGAFAQPQIRATTVNFSRALLEGARAMLLVTDGVNLADVAPALMTKLSQTPGMENHDLLGTRLQNGHFSTSTSGFDPSRVVVAGEIKVLARTVGAEAAQFLCPFSLVITFVPGVNGTPLWQLDATTAHLTELYCNQM